MSNQTVLVGASQRTYDELAGQLAPHVRLVPVPGADRAAETEEPVGIVWRRQWDRTAWVSLAMDRLPELAWIHTDTAGVDRMPLARLARQNIRLTNARGAHSPAVAEWALGAMLLAGKNLARTVVDSAGGRWVPHDDDLLLRGRGVLVLGLGDIGRNLAAACSVLGMRVLGVSRSGAPVACAHRVVGSSGPWKELLGEASFLVNCLPLTPETENMIDLSVLTRLAPPAWLVNVGRGETVVQEDVVAAVRSGALQGAVLDSVRGEPLPPESELWSCPGIVVSPHMSSLTDASEARTRELFLVELDRHLQGMPPLNLIDLKRGY